MAGQVAPHEVKARAAELRALGGRFRQAFLERVGGTSAQAVVERPRERGEGVTGLTENFVPVLLPGGVGPAGTLVAVRLGAVRGGRVRAVLRSGASERG